MYLLLNKSHYMSYKKGITTTIFILILTYAPVQM